MQLSSPAVAALLANIAQHCKYIKANLGYVRLQLRQHGERLLQAGGDTVRLTSDQAALLRCNRWGGSECWSRLAGAGSSWSG